MLHTARSALEELSGKIQGLEKFPCEKELKGHWMNRGLGITAEQNYGASGLKRKCYDKAKPMRQCLAK